MQWKNTATYSKVTVDLKIADNNLVWSKQMAHYTKEGYCNGIGHTNDPQPGHNYQTDDYIAE